MNQWAIRLLRAAIVALFAGMLFIQAFLLPLFWIDMTHAERDVAALRWPVFALGVAGAATVEVALVCIWRLLTMVRRDTVFSRSAFRFVDIVIGSAVVAWLLAVVLAFVLAPGEAVPPGAVLVVVIGGVAAAGIALLVLVLRALLAKAVALDTTARGLRAELDEVI